MTEFGSIFAGNITISIVMIVTVLAAILSPICNALYGYHYEDIVRPRHPSIKKMMIPPIIFYGIVGVLGTTIFGLWGYMSDSFVVSSDAYIWQIFWVSMIGYAVHIITEVWGRANMTMTQYNIVFQTQIVFLILFGVIFFSSFTVTIKLMLGALYVIISAILAVIDRYRDQDHTKTNSVLVTGIIMTVISAAGRGIALTSDGLIATSVFGSSFVGFGLYVALTFLIPSTIGLILYCIIESASGDEWSLGEFVDEMKSHPTKYFYASAGTAGEYYFGVLAMILNPYIAIVLQGITPVVSAVFENKKRGVSLTIISISLLCLAGIIISFV